MNKTVKSYGVWPSPLSPEAVAGQSLRFDSVAMDGGAAFWSELRPAEKGRGVIMRQRPGDAPEELLPAPFSARSRVHEYGGGEFLAANGTVWFTNDSDKDVWCLRDGVAPARVTNAPSMRFADFALDKARGRLIAVAERHDAADAHAMPENLLVAIDLAAAPEAAARPLVTGRDFFASPRLSPDGRHLAWLAWDLPHMPWETAALYVAEIDADGGIGTPKLIAGGGGAEGAVFQPVWREDGTLIFVCDKSGWGNLYVWDGATVRAIAPQAAEFGKAQWSLSARSFALLPGGRILASLVTDGALSLVIVEADGSFTPLDTDICGITTLASDDNAAILSAARDFAAPAIIRLGLDGTQEVLREGSGVALERGDIACGRMLSFPADDGGPVYGLYYPPTNSRFAAPGGELPPAIIGIHGGPNSHASRGLRLSIQYWTTRGFAFLDLDYGGSTCYGRDFRARLDGQWGVRDVADATAAAHYLAAEGLAHSDRIAINGGSSGGFTVLMALATSRLFAAGASYYGVSDLAALQRTTHKFEAGYVFGLVGARPGPGGLTDASDPVFAARSPLAHAGNINSPVILFQGLDDRVVPPEQSRLIAEELQKRGVPVTLFEFEGEGHGFRRAENVAKALYEEYGFYLRVFQLNATNPDGK